MNAFAELWRAALGWLDLITARPDAAHKFTLTPAGLVNALGFYIAVALLLIAIESQISGFPGWLAVVASLILTAAGLVVVLLIALATARLMRADAYAIAVPATYAMGFVLALTLPLAYLVGANVALPLLGVRAFLLYRAARQMAGLGIGISVAFAILCVLALVAVPLALYMLTGGGQAIGQG